MKPSEEQIREIADNLDCGFICYFHVITGEIKCLPDESLRMYTDDEEWEEDEKMIEDSIEEYLVFECPTSYEGYNFMEDFAMSIDNESLQRKLINALERRKPFSNFKWVIDNSGEYRQKWFDYKQERLMQIVRDQIEASERNEPDDSEV